MDIPPPAYTPTPTTQAMAHREPPPRLNIPPSLSAQQPILGGAMYSPSLPTAIQQSFHPPYPASAPLQTPVQHYFTPQHQPPPHRLTHQQGQPSIAQLAAAGILPPSGFPIATPVGGHFSRPSLMLGPGQHPLFPNRSRRQPSIGGPPKAVLGGPARKLSPIPPGTSVSPTPPAKTKKVLVKLPKETIISDDGESTTRPSWARNPVDPPANEPTVPPVDLVTRESYPPDSWRLMIPDIVDVFLPGKLAWSEMKHQEIEEKLEKLGVERGSGSNVPHIYAPHARAASISSPADPSLLYYKLNQLQQSRDSSAFNSLATSPRPSFGLTPSPHRSTPSIAPPKHAHTMSLAQPPTVLLSPFAEASTNPFGHDAILGDDQPLPKSPYMMENVPSLKNEHPATDVGSRPDFTRGFGLDIPEEVEEELEGKSFEEEKQADSESEDMDMDEETHRSYSQKTSPFQSRTHSRHLTKLSAHLSLGSFGEHDLIPELLRGSIDASENLQNEISHVATDDVAEWTGTETSEGDESIGEWSNPSDEERARQERVERRLRRRAAKRNIDQPRRIPNFPRPPDTGVYSLRAEGDVISNPSEENLVLSHQDQYLSVEPNYFSPSRPSQVLPHSRSGSNQYSEHDPAQAHSPSSSEQFVYPGSVHEQQSSISKKDLNPFARPFVFGVPLASSSPTRSTSTPNGTILQHERISSLGNKPPLNISAPEFKPTGFTFRPPPGVPQMPAPPSALSKFTPPPPVLEEGSPFVVQGREKRQRRGSAASMEEGDSMVSFKFPRDADSPRAIRRAISYSGAQSVNPSLNPSAEPFTFASFSAVAQPPPIPREQGSSGQTPDEVTLQDESTAKAEIVQVGAEEYGLASSSKKRAPIPLDFKQPVSNNTVPAGLFKALANGDERTRRTVRSRLDSREIFEHVRRPSMDDNDVPTISQKRPLLSHATKEQIGSVSDDDVFGASRHTRRRSSLPENLRDDISDISNDSLPPLDLTSRLELHRIEHILGELLDERFADLRQEISQTASAGGNALNPSTEAQIADVISLFRTQLQESATRSLEDSQMDARGEMDFQMIKDVVEEGQNELLNLVRAELHSILGKGESAQGNGIVAAVENSGNRVISAICETISDLSARQEAISHATPARERDILVDRLVTVLTPMISSLQTEPLDYDFLTSQLAQAVKPHISQIIDLASDKRETANLILESLLPLLPTNNSSPPIDTEALTLSLVAEVRRAIAPIDAFEIREQVADLVVERLDSRLSVRDKLFNVETISSNVNESISKLLEPSQGVPDRLDHLVDAQAGVKAHQEEVLVLTRRIGEFIKELPEKNEGGVEKITTLQKEALLKLDNLTIPGLPAAIEDVQGIRTTVNRLEETHQVIYKQSVTIADVQNDILGQIQKLPATIDTANTSLQATLVGLINSVNVLERELSDFRKINNDLQAQLTKARSDHGRVRVEKDLLNEKLGHVEADREQLRGQVDELEKATTGRTIEISTLEGRENELKTKLSETLGRLQAAETAGQSGTSRISELERVNGELLESKRGLEVKVTSLEMRLQMASHDKETTERALEDLQKQYDQLQSQEVHWDHLKETSDKLDFLTKLIGQADAEELHELRRHREESKALESEHVQLQKRFKDLEKKFMASEKNAATARQSLAQVEQKASDWEHRAKEAEGLLESTQTQLHQAEQTHAQLDADYALANLQLEERETQDRLAQEREAKLRGNISTLENRVRNLQAALEKARTPPEPAPVAYRNINGYGQSPARPDSRASTIYDQRSATPTRRMSNYTSTSSVRSETPDQTSVWDSRHAPSRPNPVPQAKNIHAPAGKYPSGLGQGTPSRFNPLAPAYSRNIAPSPTPSAVSNAPTLRDDGWYE